MFAYAQLFPGVCMSVGERKKWASLRSGANAMTHFYQSLSLGASFISRRERGVHADAAKREFHSGGAISALPLIKRQFLSFSIVQECADACVSKQERIPLFESFP